uniref:Autophagy-related protein 16 domain-containing protein n=1 Tax=Dunaliella tertiolecta TaxID=3047 RepID=A0A7S3QY31_DUNTE|eukprot:CAMPEP_0202372654 /NCGR_PEP_ID=MMETSP1127-20130417/3822_1 /ASSEMBLY_ACC=CAM_ASM_000462 /TAXON_ID=3047 /ORGANISM="Dunaliella tertiolecta, Strain CCMP1320" /LENGTH=665 /DNA_ID=CAMNT_0048969273 /DNA_START=88 /DNA_END=2085 /DNA_ORIENTATION=-
MNVAVDACICNAVASQLSDLYSLQTAPFLAIVYDYEQSIQRSRELQVRLSQLDKEGAELRDENAQLHSRLAGLQEANAADWQAQAKVAQAQVSHLEREVAGLYRDKARILEEVVSLTSHATAAKEEAERLGLELEQARLQVSKQREMLASTEAELASERTAREAASGELQASFDTREAALVEAEHLRTENASLVRRLMQTKEREIDRMNEINKQHEQMLEQAAVLRKEAAADREMATLLKQRAISEAAGGCTAEGGDAGARPLSGAALGLKAAFGGRSLRDVLGLQGSSQSRGRGGSAGCVTGGAGGAGGAGGQQAGAAAGIEQLLGRAPEAQLTLPEAPYRTVAAHKGACCSVATQAPAGHLAASCGTDHVVQMWDMHLVGTGSGPSNTLRGMTAAVNDVAFTSDGVHVIAAGTDKSLYLWDLSTGQTRHILTGHGGPVGSVAVHPTDPRLAMSCGEDRALKLWDLSRGFCARSIPCTKMPNVLACSREGSVLATGHLDGSVCLWDVRQCQKGDSAPIAKCQVHAQLVTSLVATYSDGLLLTASKDNSLALLDFRTMSTVRQLRAPTFTTGTVGSLGKGRCKAAASPTEKYVAAGGDDGGLYVWDLHQDPAAGQKGMGGPCTILRQKIQKRAEPVIAASWSADGATVISADKAGIVSFWSLAGL